MGEGYTALRTLLTNIANSIRSKRGSGGGSGHYLAPDGNYYKYKIVSSQDGYQASWYVTVYSNKKFGFSKDFMRDGFYIPQCLYIWNDTNYSAEPNTRDYTSNLYMGTTYPSGGYPDMSSDYKAFYRDASQPTGNWSFTCNPTHNPNVPIFDTRAECLAYLIAPEQIDAQDFPAEISQLPGYSMVAPSGSYPSLNSLFTAIANTLRTKKGALVSTSDSDTSTIIYQQTGKTIDVSPWISSLIDSNWKSPGSSIPNSKACTFLYFGMFAKPLLIQFTDNTDAGVKSSDIDIRQEVGQTYGIYNLKSNSIGGCSLQCRQYNGSAFNMQSSSYSIYAGGWTGIVLPAGYNATHIKRFTIYWHDSNIVAANFPNEILAMANPVTPDPDPVFTKPITDFQTLQRMICNDFITEVNACLDDNKWYAIQSKFNSMISSNPTMVAWTISANGNTYLNIGIYPSALNLGLLYDGSYSGISYSIALFPSAAQQTYSCFKYQGYNTNNWGEDTGARNKYLCSTNFFNKENLIKMVNYGVEYTKPTATTADQVAQFLVDKYQYITENYSSIRSRILGAASYNGASEPLHVQVWQQTGRTDYIYVSVMNASTPLNWDGTTISAPTGTSISGIRMCVWSVSQGGDYSNSYNFGLPTNLTNVIDYYDLYPDS